MKKIILLLVLSALFVIGSPIETFGKNDTVGQGNQNKVVGQNQGNSNGNGQGLKQGQVTVQISGTNTSFDPSKINGNMYGKDKNSVVQDADISTESGKRQGNSGSGKGNKNKLGPDTLRDILNKFATGSGEIATSAGQGRHLGKIGIHEATNAAQLSRRAVSGVVTSISGGTITLSHIIQRDRTYQVFVTDTTVITIKGIDSPTLADIQVGQHLIAVGDLAVGGGITAKLIHVIPGKAIGVFRREPVATSSPEISVTETPPLATISPTEIVASPTLP